jgi:hypothetical protein
MDRPAPPDACADPLGPLLSSPPPRWRGAEVAGLLLRHYGLAGTLAPLTSERDQNFCLTEASGARWVVKLANPAEEPAMTAFQAAALLHLERTAPALPCPRLRPAADGAAVVPLRGGGHLRVLSWQEGRPLAEVAPGAEGRRAIGALSARLCAALGRLEAGPGPVLLWDITRAGGLRALLPAVADAGLRALCARVLDRFEAEVAPRLARLPAQAIHADLNPWNVMADAAGRVAGVIDFGDMVRAPRICDLAVAASYHARGAAPQAAVADLAAGFHAETPLEGEEIALLPALVATRMTATLTIASWRAARQPENAPYILRNLPASAEGLAALSALPAGAAEEAVRAALGAGGAAPGAGGAAPGAEGAAPGQGGAAPEAGGAALGAGGAAPGAGGAA